MVLLLGLGSTSPRFVSCCYRNRRFVRGAQRLGATPGSNDRARTASAVVALRNAAEHPLASLCRDERKGGSIGSYALRVFDDTRDLKDSRRRRNPELNGVSRHSTTLGLV